MIAYILRRLALMVLTLVGILLITFAAVRLQGPSLMSEISHQLSGDREGNRISQGLDNLQVYLLRFHRTGNDLPALINTRGFASKATVLEWIKATERTPRNGSDEADLNQRQINLLFMGPLIVEPLAEIIADPRLERYLGPASSIFSMCARFPLGQDDESLPLSELTRIQDRNHALSALRIAFTNDHVHGFTTTDPDAHGKRDRILALFQANRDVYGRTTFRIWSAILFDTGFSVLMGNLFTGHLYSDQRQVPVFSLIAQRWKVTFLLNLVSIILAWGLSIPIGIRSARRLGTWEDRITTNALFLLWSLPGFFVGTLLLHHLCTDTVDHKAWFPNAGLYSPDSTWLSTWGYLSDLLWHGFLPLVVLTYSSFTSLSRYMRGNMLEQLGADYARTARAKGCSEDQVVYGHALRNSMVTMITLGSGLLSDLFGSSIIVETIFSIPGLGQLTYQSSVQQDAPVLMATTVVSVVLLLVGILVADILYAVVDPRVRVRYG